jgi:hypothetical protein
VVFRKRDLLLFIYDDVASDQAVEQFWHFGEAAAQISPSCWRIGTRGCLLISGSATANLSTGEEHGWRSRVLGRKEPAQVLRLPAPNTPATRFVTLVDLSGRMAATEELAAAEAQEVRN